MKDIKKPLTIALTSSSRAMLDAQVERIQHLKYGITDAKIRSRSEYINLLINMIEYMSDNDIKRLIKQSKF